MTLAQSTGPPAAWQRKNSAWKRFNQSTLVRSIVAISLVFYFWIWVNVPFSLHVGAIHDDGLFVAHAFSIARGKWLGPYSQFTLMKGPGYPIFLALLAMLKISPPFAHAAIHSGSVGLLAHATRRLTGSLWLGLAVFECLLWDFGSQVPRLLRENLYAPLLISVFALLLLMFLSPVWHKKKFLAICSGILWGWFWITREEGMAAIPGMLLLWACLSHVIWQGKSEWRPWIRLSAMLLGSSAAVWITVASINFAEYHTFTIVDVNGPCAAAVQAIQSVRPDHHIPFVPAPRSAREKIYRVSPTFSQLRYLLEDPASPVGGWKSTNCSKDDPACGDYSGTVFFWAFRHAATLNGVYKSSGDAARFFSAIHDEISAACKQHRLDCDISVLPLAPRIEAAEVAHIPSSLKNAIALISFAEPPPTEPERSFGSPEELRDADMFLSLGYFSPAPSGSPYSGTRILIHGQSREKYIVNLYHWFAPVLLSAGILATIGGLVLQIVGRKFSLLLGIACSAWILVIGRVLALTLIDISTFFAMMAKYINYCYPFSLYASLIAIYSVCISLKGRSRQHLNGSPGV